MLPVLMQILNYDRRDLIKFGHVPGFNVTALLKDVDAYCSLYVPDPTFPAARISITGDQMIAECYAGWRPTDPFEFAQKCGEKMGLHRDQVVSGYGRTQAYAKILPIDEGERRRFIMWASDNHGVYSLGRFATWRPGLLLDDVVNDVRVIHRLIGGGSDSYHHRKR